MRILYVGMASSSHIWRWYDEFKNRGHGVALAHDDQSSRNGILYDFRAQRKDIVKHLILHPKDVFKSLRYLRGIDALRSYGYFAACGHLLAQAINDFKPDIVHAHYASTYGPIAYYSHFNPYMLSIWGSDLYIDSHNSSLLPHLKAALDAASMVQVESEKQRTLAAKLGAKKLLVQNWGVDIDHFHPNKMDGNLRKELKLASNVVLISTRTLYVGRYGNDVILKALKRVRERFPSVKLLMCSDGKDRNYLMKLANELSLSDSVIFLGLIDYDKLPYYYTLADIYVQAPYTDGVSYSVLEAMASGLPVISSNVGDTEENVREEHNGLLFPPGDYEKLSELIIELIADEGRRAELATNARRWVVERCARRMAFDIFESKYRQIQNT